MKLIKLTCLGIILGGLLSTQTALAASNYRVGSFVLKGSVKMAINERQLVFERINSSLAKFGFKADAPVSKVPGDGLELNYTAGDKVKFSEALHCTLKLNKKSLTLDFNSSEKLVTAT